MIKLRPDAGERQRITIPVRAPKRRAIAALRVIAEPAGPDTDELQAERPRTRAACADGPRPCPWVSCRHHLFLSVDPTSGAILIPDASVPVWEMSETCALDVADRGGTTRVALGELLSVTKERVHQVEDEALAAMRGAAAGGDPRPLKPAKPHLAHATAEPRKVPIYDRLLEIIAAREWTGTDALIMLSGAAPSSVYKYASALERDLYIERRTIPHRARALEWRVTARGRAKVGAP